MKRQIAALMIALPLGTVSLLPKSASAAEIHPQFSSNHPSVIVAQRRDENRYRNDRDDRGHHKFWVKGHWERGFHGHLKWVPGHWEYRR